MLCVTCCRLQTTFQSRQKAYVEALSSAYNQVCTRRRFRVTTTDSGHNLPIAPNLLNRNFTPAAPNQTWAGDITYIATEEGWLFLAVVIDLFSRRVVGWSMQPEMRRNLVIDALEMAWFQRRPDQNNKLIFIAIAAASTPATTSTKCSKSMPSRPR
jgi:transposase InsO family protein